MSYSGSHTLETIQTYTHVPFLALLIYIAVQRQATPPWAFYLLVLFLTLEIILLFATLSYENKVLLTYTISILAAVTLIVLLSSFSR